MCTNNNGSAVVVSGGKISPINNKTMGLGGGGNKLMDKERLFKRRDEGYMSGTRSRQLRRKQNVTETRQSLDKERSSSLSRLLDE